MTSEHTKYNDMTDGQLNVEIAKRHGWHVDDTPSGYALIAPDGHCWCIASSGRLAWDSAVIKWVENADKTLDLIKDFWIEIGQQRVDDKLRLVSLSDRIGVRFVGYDPQSITRAACIAWLLWKDAQ